MALTTIQGVNDALPGQAFAWQKVNGSTVSSTWLSQWTGTGAPGTGVAPSSGLSGDVPTKATTGAPNFVNPASGNTYLGRLATNANAVSTQGSLFAVYDRLWHNSGINVTSTSPQTITSTALTRPDANGARVEAWWETYAAMGSGTPTVTLAYTDQDNNAETTGTSGALATTMDLGRCGQFRLAAGDTGVRSIQTWTASATFTSGTIGLVLRRMLTAVGPVGPAPASYDALGLGLPRVYDDACLEVLCFCLSANTPVASARLFLIQG